MDKSFYKLDYIIETSEKRLEQYTQFYYKVSERVTNIILIYSAFGIFLIQLTEHIIKGDMNSVIFYICLISFASLLITSIIFFVRLLIPVHVAYLDPPRKYADEFRMKMENIYPGQAQLVDDSLKASYIMEINKAIDNNFALFRRKSSFYHNSLLCALLAAVPYVICLGYHLSEENKARKPIESVHNK